jgi:DNA-binding NarL/FixJ family response regulator
MRILLGESHRVMRQTLRAAVDDQPGWLVCGEAATAAELVARAGSLAPDVIVMDVGLAGGDAVALVRELRTAAPPTPILVIGVYESRELCVQFQDAGAKGYLLKPDVGHSLARALRALVDRGTFFRDHIQHEAGSTPADMAEEPPRLPLTAREREVLRLLAGGESNKQVAAALSISINTVETHRARIMNKLDLHSMNAVVRYALRKGLIDL